MTRQRVGQIHRDDPTFPRPVTRISQGPIWYRSMIELWAAIHRPAMPLAENPFAEIGVPLLRAAELHSRSLELGYVVSEHLWLGLGEPELLGRVNAVLDSLGVDQDAMELALRRLPKGRRPHDAEKLSISVGERLKEALARARAAGRAEVGEIDIALALVDFELEAIRRAKPRSKTNWLGGRQADSALVHLEARGLDPTKLRKRLLAVESEPSAIDGFERRTLRRWRQPRRKLRKPPWLDLAPNPLGHDPWERRGWVSVFFMTPEGRQYMVDGYQWFFHVDADGFPVRTKDGRPVGYRWRVFPKPAIEKEQDLEVLPMPPDPVANWPDRRYGDDA